eukprot:gene45637-56863_t
MQLNGGDDDDHLPAAIENGKTASSSTVMTAVKSDSDSNSDLSEDEEFVVDEGEMEVDDETTMIEQEAGENPVDVQTELNLLEQEASLPIDQLRAMYAGLNSGNGGDESD